MQVQMKRGVHWLFGIAASVSVVVILLISAFEAAMYVDFGYYQREYEKYNVLEDLDMEMEDVMYVTEEMMEYLRENREELKVITMVEGTRQDFFNEQDRFHMGEVQGLFLGGLRLRALAIFVFVCCVLILSMTKADLIRILSKSWYIVLGIFLVAVVALGVAVIKDFNTVFTLFHEIFFDNDLWIFDPETDYMIRMLPEGLFYDFVIRIGGIFMVGMGMVSVLSVVVRHRQEKGRRREKTRKISNTYE